MDKRLIKEQLRANREFRMLNHDARESGWSALTTNKDKAEFDLKRFLRETFLSQACGIASAEDNVVVLEISKPWTVEEVARPLGLFTDSAKAPLNSDGSIPRLDRWVVIGTTRTAVSGKLLEISSLRQAGPKPRPRQTARKSVQSIKWPAYPSDRDRRSSPTSMIATSSRVKEEIAGAKAKGGWDVTGKWRIYCQAIEEMWPQDCRRGLSMTIFQSKAGQKYQLWADFDFGVLSGVFRFMEPEKHADMSGGETKAKSSAVHPSSFKITSLPSPSHPFAPFRWRGEVSDKGEIQLHSDEVPHTLIFSGPDGDKCNGIFEFDFANPARFSGFRVGAARRHYLRTAREEWKERSAGAYERQSISRWGGWHHFEISDDEEDDEEGTKGDGASDNSEGDEDEQGDDEDEVE